MIVNTSTNDVMIATPIAMIVGVCVDDGWFKQPGPSQNDWTVWLGEAANLWFKPAITTPGGDFLHCSMDHQCCVLISILP